jgi:hypothetical protein
VAFPEVTFEQAVLSLLREIDPHEILNGDSGPDETLVLAGELAACESEIAKLEASLLRGFSEAVERVLHRQEQRKKALAEELAQARQKAANPLCETWGEAQSLLETLEAAPDVEEARLKLRSALRRIVREGWLLVVPKGKDRLCALQIYFHTDKAGKQRRRDFVVFHRTRRNNGKAKEPGGWFATSLASVVESDDLDMRIREHVHKLEQALISIDLTAWTGA